jgi:hypothetical protein
VEDWEAWDKRRELTGEIAQKLVDLLGNNGIEARVANEAYEFPAGTLLIVVGDKPNHVLEETIRELGGQKRVAFSSDRRGIPYGRPQASNPK